MEQGSLQKTAVPLLGGLDLVSPRSSSPPGTLQDCLNYETSPIIGYSVSNGFARYDGRLPCFIKDWVVAKKFFVTGSFATGDILYDGSRAFGTVLHSDVEGVHYLMFDTSSEPKNGATIKNNSGTSSIKVDSGAIWKASELYSDEKSFLTAQNAIYDVVRSSRKAVYPEGHNGRVTPHGLHWFKGRLYAIIDNYTLAFTDGTEEPKPGDLIGNSARTTYGTVLSTTVTSGSWDDGTAEGFIAIRPDKTGSDNTFFIGQAYVHRPNGATAFTTIASAKLKEFRINRPARVPSAGLYVGPYDDEHMTQEQVKANEGKTWTPVDMGWEIGFSTDNTTTGTAPAALFRGEMANEVVTNVQTLSAKATATTLDSTASPSAPMGTGTQVSPVQTSPLALHTVLSDGLTTTFVRSPAIEGPKNYSSTYATINGFTDLGKIPDGSIITGIEVITKVSGSTIPFGGRFRLTGTQIDAQVASPSVKMVGGVVGSNVELVMGSPTDLWGIETLSQTSLLDAIRDPSFGINFNFNTTAAALQIGEILISELSMRVHYKQTVTKYYAYDPVGKQDVQVGIPFYRLLKGQFNPGADQNLYGSGTMSLYDITALDSIGASSGDTKTKTIGNGWELRTARGGGGVLIAKFTSQMKAASLPTQAKMSAAKKRFVIYTANYYANAEWKAFYGASGCGPAFTYDGYYFINIRTALPETEDKPTHTTYHRNYNVLGYENGQCLVSVPGVPTNFIPEQGATIYPFGDRITGLLSLNGTSLGVFCESSIHALAGDVLAAVSSNNAVSQVISPYSGAIEYTVVDCGTPLFTDFRGISTIDATNKYGDFENGRVSHLVTPFLSNRVNERFSAQAIPTDVLFALPVRSKNQYRLFFADGTILTCTLPSGERGYEFTKQKYEDSTNLLSYVPLAACYGTSKGGRDLLFATFQTISQNKTNLGRPSPTSEESYVYELDKGYRFDKSPIRHFVRLNFQTLGAVNDFDLIRKVRIEALTHHVFDQYMSLTTDYGEPSVSKRLISIDPSGKTVRVDKGADYVIVPAEGRGTTISIEIGGEHMSPGHTLQSLVVYSLPGREQLGNSPSQRLT